MSLARRHPPFLDKITGIMPVSALSNRSAASQATAHYALVSHAPGGGLVKPNRGLPAKANLIGC